MLLEKSLVFLFLLSWVWGGIYLIINFQKIFGPHVDDPSETPGARSFGQTQIWSVWIGIIAVGVYFLFK